jgi:hypothetical protein
MKSETEIERCLDRHFNMKIKTKTESIINQAWMSALSWVLEGD